MMRVRRRRAKESKIEKGVAEGGGYSLYGNFRAVKKSFFAFPPFYPVIFTTVAVTYAVAFQVVQYFVGISKCPASKRIVLTTH